MEKFVKGKSIKVGYWCWCGAEGIECGVAMEIGIGVIGVAEKLFKTLLSGGL
jgi:hypothetical protein